MHEQGIKMQKFNKRVSGDVPLQIVSRNSSVGIATGYWVPVGS
jgi:hypothetical protein